MRGSIIYIFCLSILFLVWSCRGGSNSGNTPPVFPNQWERKLVKLVHSNKAFTKTVSGSFKNYEAGDDIAKLYDPQKGLELNYVKTSKKGKQPLILFLPPGSFLSYDKDELLTMHMCREFARAGFNTASISYTKITDFNLNDFSNLRHYVKSKIGQAIGDVATAVHYLQDNSDNLNFDENQIFVIGHSAGGILALHAAFTDAKELEAYSGNQGLNYQRPQIKGVVSISGGLLANDYDDSDVVKQPILLLHGDADQVVPIGFDQAYNEVIKDQEIALPTLLKEIVIDYWGKEVTIKSLKTSFYIPKWVFKYSIGLFLPDLIGSENIYETATENVQLYVFKGGEHVFMVNENGTLNQSYKVMREKILTFLKQHSN